MLFAHLAEDDGKTPYIYDMWVNVGLPAGYRFCTYGKINSTGDVKTRKSNYGGMQVLIEEGEKMYLFEFHQDVEIASSDDLYSILKEAGTIE